MKWDPFIFGIACICISAVVMVYGHEYSFSGIVFIVGMGFVGYSYATSSKAEGKEINTEEINKNIQTLNDILWGKDRKETVVKLSPERFWQISVQDKCRDIRNTWGACYCYYGGRRGYCAFERCPRRNN